MILRSGARNRPAALPGRLALASSLAVLAGCALRPAADGGGVPEADASGLEYRVYVANESSDLVSRVAFSRSGGARVEREIPVGIMPADTDGPHGVLVSPDRRFLYVTVAHGTPDGWLWKFRAGADTLVGRTELGRFPATLSSSPDGRLLVVANFDLHGDPAPSSLSVVFAPELSELARITTCMTPHGSRIAASGRLHYSVCMQSDQLVELSLATFAVTRRMSLRPGSEGPLSADDAGPPSPPGPAAPSCAPTWVSPGVAGRADRFLYVTCSARAEVLEVETAGWRIARRFATGPGPYNTAATPDGGRLLVTLRSGGGVSVISLDAGEETARLGTTESFTHGVVVSPDGRYAFVTNEAVGSTPGTLDVFDLSSLELAASVELRHQAGGIAFWRTDRSEEEPAAGG